MKLNEIRLCHSDTCFSAKGQGHDHCIQSEPVTSVRDKSNSPVQSAVVELRCVILHLLRPVNLLCKLEGMTLSDQNMSRICLQVKGGLNEIAVPCVFVISFLDAYG